MDMYRYILSVVTATLLLSCVNNEQIKTKLKTSHSANCPFARFVNDILKTHNKTSEAGIYVKDNARAKLFLHSLSNITNRNSNDNEEDVVNDIIATINRIKNNITVNDVNNEAIMLDMPDKSKIKAVNQIKSGVEDKVDIKHTNATKKDTASHYKSADASTTERTKYVEILTIEPNNTNISNTTSHNIIEVLKHLMPMFNSTLTKELHNITIIERNHLKNHSFSATKNVSTIVVTYCDKENFTQTNLSEKQAPANISTVHRDDEYDYYLENDYDEEDEDEDLYDEKPENVTASEHKDIMEAAEYGMQKMHELYSVLEPKLYSMGLWLDDTNPARYVAAFNAPTEDAARYSRYGYASLQAATRLKQLTSGGNAEGIEGRTDESQFPTASALRQSPLMQHCPLRGPPKCPPASKRYRTHDGTCNNLNRPRWGSTMTPVQRFLTPSYSDGLQAPRTSIFGTQLPSAREISSVVHESEHVENPGITHLLMQWGQFIDHDITSTSQSRGFNGSVPRCCRDGGRDFIPNEFLHPECYPIAVPQSDPFYGSRGVRCLDFVRSSPAPKDNCALGWREQLNQVSAYIDGSPVYGSSARQSDKLRLFRNGMLQYGRVQQRRPILPPERRDELCRGGAVSTDCFKSGDARVNEHPGLVAAHIVWLRQHNRMAQELAHLNPNWSDEKIYQETRKIVGAMIQHITYREWLPIVLGSEVMRLFELEPQKKGYYKGYSVKINSSPSSSFGSAAFRFGHSLVQPSMVRFDRFHRPMRNNVSLHDELTNPSNIWSMGAVDRLLLGMVNQPIQKRDEFITAELTNHLFQTPQFDFGMDLAAINIQRGRDHGVPPYTSWREPCGLSAILEFDDLFRVMPARAVKKLKTLYRHVDDIDLFTGGMAERPVVSGLVGPTFACIIAQQFSNLRKGDRFWYENGDFDSSFTPAQLQQIRRISFAQVLCRTLDTIDSIQPFVFLSPDNPDNDRISCQNGLLNNFDLSPWVEVENNEVRETVDDETTSVKPKRKLTTTKPTTKRTIKGASKLSQKKPESVTVTEDEIDFKLTDIFNGTTNNITVTNKTLTDKITKTNKTSTEKVTKPTTVKIDDKLDFKNKSKRFDDVTFTDKIDSRQNSKSKYDEYDYEDDDENTQSVQSLLVNNFQNRPYNNHNHKRPVITVTENIDKYTYLINYVPRPTVSWRQTTRRPITRRTTTRRPEKNVVKVTYQNYADTYRRPNPYYYNRRDSNKDNYRYDSSITTNVHSSARSNDETTTIKPKLTDIEKTDSTTENLFKLITFGYVGNYKGDMPDKINDKLDDDLEINNKDKNEVKRDAVSKEFVTFDNSDMKDKFGNAKLSTFYLYETATKPYLNSQRPTRRNDEDTPTKKTNSKYYYVKNVLHKYPDDLDIPKPHKSAPKEVKENIKITEVAKKFTDNHNNTNKSVHTSNVEERSSIGKLSIEELEEITTKNKPGNKLRANVRKPPSSTKTPSVAFQVIPSENSPTQWAVYDENANLSETIPFKMPTIKGDPYALKEIPRPMNFGLRRRRPGRS